MFAHSYQSLEHPQGLDRGRLARNALQTRSSCSKRPESDPYSRFALIAGETPAVRIQRKSAPILVSLLILVCLGGSGCGVALTALSRGKDQKAPAALSSSDAKRLIVVPDLQADPATDIKAYEKYAAQIEVYLNLEKFDEIDRLADAVRADKARFTGGAWKLHKLYKGLSLPNGRKAPEEIWQLHLNRLKRWTVQKPESITARVALADNYVGYAWAARGNEFASKVKEESWKPFHDRLAMAEGILNDARKLKARCPHWYLVMQIVAKGQSWEWEPYNKIFEEGVAFEPSYHYLYSEKAQNLLPRWHGEEGDWERFAEETSQRLGRKGRVLL